MATKESILADIDRAMKMRSSSWQIGERRETETVISMSNAVKLMRR